MIGNSFKSASTFAARNESSNQPQAQAEAVTQFRGTFPFIFLLFVWSTKPQNTACVHVQEINTKRCPDLLGLNPVVPPPPPATTTTAKSRDHAKWNTSGWLARIIKQCIIQLALRPPAPVPASAKQMQTMQPEMKKRKKKWRWEKKRFNILLSKRSRNISTTSNLLST